jgi:hypothetical protein
MRASSGRDAAGAPPASSAWPGLLAAAWMASSLCGCTNDYDGLAGSAASTGSASSSGAGGATGSGGAGGAGAASSSSASNGGSAGDGGAGGGLDESLIFAHTKSAFYRYRPEANTLLKAADFDGCHDVKDIALDNVGRMYATSYDGALYTVDTSTGACDELEDSNTGYYPESLGWVPAGAIDQDPWLVAYDGNDYLRIDPASGVSAVVTAGVLGAVEGIDLVAPKGGDGWAIVSGVGCENHCLAPIQLATGAITGVQQAFGVYDVYGLAWHQGIAYGFHHTGAVYAVEPGMPVTLILPDPGGEPEAVVGAASRP